MSFLRRSRQARAARARQREREQRRADLSSQLPPELAVYYAWVDVGPAPSYHRNKQFLLRMEWPTLAQALDRMQRVYDRNLSEPSG